MRRLKAELQSQQYWNSMSINPKLRMNERGDLHNRESQQTDEQLVESDEPSTKKDPYNPAIKERWIRWFESQTRNLKFDDLTKLIESNQIDVHEYYKPKVVASRLFQLAEQSGDFAQFDRYINITTHPYLLSELKNLKETKSYRQWFQTLREREANEIRTEQLESEIEQQQWKEQKELANQKFAELPLREQKRIRNDLKQIINLKSPIAASKIPSMIAKIIAACESGYTIDSNFIGALVSSKNYQLLEQLLLSSVPINLSGESMSHFRLDTTQSNRLIDLEKILFGRKPTIGEFLKFCLDPDKSHLIETAAEVGGRQLFKDYSLKNLPKPSGWEDRPDLGRPFKLSEWVQYKRTGSIDQPKIPDIDRSSSPQNRRRLFPWSK